MNPAEDEVARVHRDAECRDIHGSSLVPEAIEAHFGTRPGTRHLLSVGAGRSGWSDVSERIDDILAAELGTSS